MLGEISQLLHFLVGLNTGFIQKVEQNSSASQAEILNNNVVHHFVLEKLRYVHRIRERALDPKSRITLAPAKPFRPAAAARMRT